MRSAIGVLESRMSSNPRLARVQRRVIATLNPEWSVWRHHHIKALWHRDRIDQVLQGKAQAVMPVTVEFVPSLDCNLACKTCTYRLWKERTAAQAGKRQMPYEVMMTLLDKIEDAGVMGVIFTGGGEPLVNPHTIDGLEYAAGKSFRVGLFTNGALLKEQDIERLSGIELGFIRVSFNSADANNYLAFHGIRNPRVFERAKRNIRLLAKALSTTETGFGLGVIVNEVNVDFMHTVAEFARSVLEEEPDANLGYIAFRPVLNYGQIDPDLTQQISREVAEKAIANFERVKRILEGLPVTPILAEDYFVNASQGIIGEKRNYQGCLGHPWGGSIAYDSGLYLCSERDGDPEFLMGNLVGQTWQEIWGSAQRQTAMGRIGTCPPTCKIHRTNVLLAALTSEGSLTEPEILELQTFLDIIRDAGDPGGIYFI